MPTFCPFSKTKDRTSVAEKKYKKRSSGSRPPIEDRYASFNGIEINVPSKDLLGYTIFLYGPPKVGKSCAALSWPDSIVVACETKGIKAFEVPNIKCRAWEHVQKAIDLLATPKNLKKYKTVIIDTVDLMFKYCLSFCCDKYGFDHPSDQGWGKGWERLTDEFLASILNLFDLGYTLIFISHTKSTLVKGDWEEYTHIDPTLSGVGRKVLLPLVDVIFYMRARENKNGVSVRTLTTKATREYEAGDRTHCLTDMEIIIPAAKKDSAFEIINRRFMKNVKD